MLQFLQQRLSNRFVRNIGWLGAAQLCIRVFRLATTIVLAKLLTPYDYGLAALVLTTNEFVNVFTKNGIWAKLIQVDAEQLEEHCQTAYWMNWIVCGTLFVLQCGVALRSPGSITILRSCCQFVRWQWCICYCHQHSSMPRLSSAKIACRYRQSLTRYKFPATTSSPWALPSSGSDVGDYSP